MKLAADAGGSADGVQPECTHSSVWDDLTVQRPGERGHPQPVPGTA